MKRLSIDQYAYGYLMLAMGLAAYLGARMPSLWSINYYLPSFFEGFYRRGLLGTLLYPLGELRFNYAWLSSIQIGVLLILLIFFLKYAYTAKIQQKIMLFLFFLAPTGGYFFHIIGYSDQLLFLLLMVALMLIRFPWVGIVLMTASLFIHEAALFITIPIYMMALLSNRVSFKWMILYVAVMSSAFLCLTLFFQTVPVPKIEMFIAKVAQKMGPVMRWEYYSTFHNHYTTQAVENTFYDLQNAVAPPPRGNFIYLYFEIALLLVYATLVATLFVDSQSSKVHQVFSYIAAWFACLMPLLLVFFGIDADRWVFLAYATSVFMFCMAKKMPSNAWFLSIIVVYLIFTRYGHFWYFDGCSPRGFEFLELQAFLKGLTFG